MNQLFWDFLGKSHVHKLSVGWWASLLWIMWIMERELCIQANTRAWSALSLFSG